MRLGIVSCVLAFVVGAMLSPVAGRAAETPGGIATDPILQPPFEDGKPIDVVIGLHIVNIASIDEVDEQSQMDAYLFARWKDSGSHIRQSGPDDQERNYAFGQIWIPQLEMINAATPRNRYDSSIRVTPDGTVNYAERCKVGLSSKFALRHFPFDRQSLVIIIHPFLVDGPHIRFKLIDTSAWTASEFESYSSLAQWRLTAVEPRVGVASTYGGLTVPEAQFRNLRPAALEFLHMESVSAAAADGLPVVGGLLDRGGRSLKPDPGRGHHDLTVIAFAFRSPRRCRGCPT